MKDLSKLIICIIAAAALTAALTSDLKAQVIGGLMMNKVYTTDEIVSVLGAPDTIRWDCYYIYTDRFDYNGKGRRPHFQSQGDGLLYPRGKIR